MNYSGAERCVRFAIAGYVVIKIAHTCEVNALRVRATVTSYGTMHARMRTHTHMLRMCAHIAHRKVIYQTHHRLIIKYVRSRIFALEANLFVCVCVCVGDFTCSMRFAGVEVRVCVSCVGIAVHVRSTGRQLLLVVECVRLGVKMCGFSLESGVVRMLLMRLPARDDLWSYLPETQRYVGVHMCKDGVEPLKSDPS